MGSVSQYATIAIVKKICIDITVAIVAAPDNEESPASVDEWIKVDGKDALEPLHGVLPMFKKKYWPVISTVLREMSFELAGAATFQVLVNTLV